MVAFRAAQVILFSDDLPRAVAFYSRLGFTETFRVPADGEPIHVDLVLSGYKIGIATAASAREDHGLTPIAEGQRVAVIARQAVMTALPGMRRITLERRDLVT